MAAARLNIPALFCMADPSPPASLKAIAVTIQDVFEAVGIHSQRQHERRPTSFRWKSLRVPVQAPAADNLPPTPWRMVCEFLGIAPMGLSSVPATNSAKAAAGQARRRTGPRSSAQRCHAIENHHQDRHRKRHYRRRGQRRLHQLRAAPLGHRQRSQIPLTIDDLIASAAAPRFLQT